MSCSAAGAAMAGAATPSARAQAPVEAAMATGKRERIGIIPFEGVPLTAGLPPVSTRQIDADNMRRLCVVRRTVEA
ncbi:hypothetical protein GCM10010478_16930 [Streptomyces erythrogriseus]|uniref:Uncharacterized protein n=2 Tax=Streptomyces griseoincarnatus group TaxID=2867193 RepID=A0ABN3WLH0_9ACTN|nr:hypothetical protein GCM10010265_38080 [Streptomyces griseoincarnatus]GGT34341.1 hypothetical protein GCM10010287_03500 [Streptomyces variabilis]